MSWSNKYMYEGGLRAHESVKGRLMLDMYGESSGDELMSHPLMLLDTAGALMYEGIDEQS